MVASTCTLGRCMPVSLTSTARLSAIATCKRTRRRFLRLSHPIGTILSSPSNACSPGTWLADLCAREGIPFVLGHALSMKAIHGGKAKHAKIDAPKMAVLLRGGMLPQADV